MSAEKKETTSVTLYNKIKAYGGYTLFAPAGRDNVYLVDMKGQFVHKWKLPYPTVGHGVLLPNGNLLFAAKSPSGPLAELEGTRGELFEMTWDGSGVWKYEDPYMHDDFYRMKNGHTIVIRWIQTPADIANRVKGGLQGTEREGVMWCDSFREINPRGRILWEWFGYEHLDPEVDTICPLCSRSEWTHASSCVFLPNGNILTSFTRINTVAVIDKATGNIEWRWGSEELGHQHDASVTESRNILVFDSGVHVPWVEMGYSQVREIDITTNKEIWGFRHDPWVAFYAPCMGNCQRLPNGNTLICQGDTGRIFEITPHGETVWEFISPFYHSSAVYGRNNMLFRAYRYGYDYLGLKGAKFNL